VKKVIFKSRQELRRTLRKLGLTSTEAIIRKWEKDPKFPEFNEGAMRAYNLLNVLIYAIGETNAEILYEQYLNEDSTDDNATKG